MFDSLQPKAWWLQYTRLCCPSLSPGVCSDSRPLSQWYYPIISSPVTSFSSYLQSFPATGSLPMSLFFISGGQSIGVSASASILPMNIQCWFPLELTDLISFLDHGTLKSLLQPHSSKASVLWCSAFFMAQLSHLRDRYYYPHSTDKKNDGSTRYNLNPGSLALHCKLGGSYVSSQFLQLPWPKFHAVCVKTVRH